MARDFAVMTNIPYRQIFCDLVSVFFFKKQLFLGIFLGVILVALAVALLAPPIYTVSADLLLKPVQSKSYLPDGGSQDVYIDAQLPEKDMETYAVPLKSSELLKQVVIRSGLAGADDEVAIARLTDHLRSHLKVEVLGKSNTVHVSLRGGDPREITQQLGILVDAYLQHRTRPAPGDLAFFEQRSALLQRQYEKLSNLVGQTIRQKGLIDPVTQKESELSVTRDLELRKNALMTELIKVSDRRKSVERALQGFRTTDRLIGLPKEIINDYPAMTEMDKTLTQLIIELRRADHDFVPGSWPVVEAKAHYADMRRQGRLYLEQILGDLNMHETSLKQAVTVMGRQISGIQDKALNTASAAPELDRLKLELDLLKDQYVLYSKNRDEALIREVKDRTSAVDISLAAAPQPPLRPVFPRLALLLPGGILLGLLLAMTSSAIVYRLERRLRTPTDIGLHTPLCCLGELERAAIPHPSSVSSDERGAS